MNLASVLGCIPISRQPRSKNIYLPDLYDFISLTGMPIHSLIAAYLSIRRRITKYSSINTVLAS